MYEELIEPTSTITADLPKWEQATPADADACAKLIFSSGPVAFEWVFSHSHGPFVNFFLHQCFKETNNQFSYTFHRVQKSDNDVLGCIALYDAKRLNDCFIGTAKTIFRHYGLRSLFKGLRFEHRLARPPKKHCLYLAHIAIKPEAQGQGLARHLIDQAYQHAKRTGYSALSLDVAANNHRARALYLGLGFKEVRFNTSFNTILDDHIYMEKEIDPNETNGEYPA